MTAHSTSKDLVLDHWERLDADEPATRAAATEHMSPDVEWHGHAPVGTKVGRDQFIHGAWEPLCVFGT